MNAVGKILAVLALGAIALLGYGCYRADTPEGRAKAADREKIAQCVRARDDELNELSTRRFMREACQQMENEFVAKYGISSREL